MESLGHKLRVVIVSYEGRLRRIHLPVAASFGHGRQVGSHRGHRAPSGAGAAMGAGWCFWRLRAVWPSKLVRSFGPFPSTQNRILLLLRSTSGSTYRVPDHCFFRSLLRQIGRRPVSTSQIEQTPSSSLPPQPPPQPPPSTVYVRLMPVYARLRPSAARIHRSQMYRYSNKRYYILTRT